MNYYFLPDYFSHLKSSFLHTSPVISHTLYCSLGLFLPLAAVHEVVQDVHGHGEDDGRVVLRRDAVQRLKVAELQGRRKDPVKNCKTISSGDGKTDFQSPDPLSQSESNES